MSKRRTLSCDGEQSCTPDDSCSTPIRKSVKQFHTPFKSPLIQVDSSPKSSDQSPKTESSTPLRKFRRTPGTFQSPLISHEVRTGATPQSARRPSSELIRYNKLKKEVEEKESLLRKYRQLKAARASGEIDKV